MCNDTMLTIANETPNAIFPRLPVPWRLGVVPEHVLEHGNSVIFKIKNEIYNNPHLVFFLSIWIVVISLVIYILHLWIPLKPVEPFHVCVGKILAKEKQVNIIITREPCKRILRGCFKSKQHQKRKK